MALIFNNNVIYSPTSSIEYGDEKKPIKIINIDQDRRLEVPLMYPYINKYYPKVITYIDINKDKNLRKKMVNYFKNNFLNKWIYNSNELMNYFSINNNKVKIVKKKIKKKYNSKNISKISKFIEKKILNEKYMYKILKEYISIFQINWYDLINIEIDVKNFIIKKLINKIKKEK